MRDTKKKYSLLFLPIFLILILIPFAALAVDDTNLAKPIADFIYCYIERIFRLLIWLAGFGTSAMIVVGGFLYITSSGDPTKVKKATSTLTAAVVGFIITACSFAIVYFAGTKVNPDFSWSYNMVCSYPGKINPSVNPLTAPPQLEKPPELPIQPETCSTICKKDNAAAWSGGTCATQDLSNPAVKGCPSGSYPLSSGNEACTKQNPAQIQCCCVKKVPYKPPEECKPGKFQYKGGGPKIDWNKFLSTGGKGIDSNTMESFKMANMTPCADKCASGLCKFLFEKAGLGDDATRAKVRKAEGESSDCGLCNKWWTKPLVYFYPISDMDIRFSIDSPLNFKILDPLPDNGSWVKPEWDFHATTNSDLTFKSGNKYGYVFYETDAPKDIFDRDYGGWKIKLSDFDGWMKRTLPTLGLNEKETRDFHDYWSISLRDWIPNIDDYKYLKITMMDYASLDELAKLNVTPKPDSIIRVDLIFEPTNNQEPVKPINIKIPVRKGFVVAEWGVFLQSSKDTK